jgi:hypothetical protein
MTEHRMPESFYIGWSHDQVLPAGGCHTLLAEAPCAVPRLAGSYSSSGSKRSF